MAGSIGANVLVRMLVSAALGVALSACGKIGFSETNASSEGIQKCDASSSPDCGVIAGPGEYMEKTFEVPNTMAPVDILFVVDNSGSMEAELATLGDKFGKFTQALAGKDWQACLATTDWENEKGALRKWSNGAYVLGPGTSGYASVFRESMGESLFEGTNDDSNTEQGIITAHQVFSKFGKAENRGCLRANSKKSVIFVSDEDELNNGWDPAQPLGTPRANNLPQNFLNLTTSLFGANSGFSAHLIGVVPGDNQCLMQQRWETGSYRELSGFFAVRYAEIVAATGGEMVSICDQDYTEPLARIGSKILNTVAETELPCPAGAFVKSVATGSGFSTPHTFTVSGNLVTFLPALGAGEQVKIMFRCL